MLLIVTVVCAGDVKLGRRRVEWMRELGQEATHDLLLINDGTVGESEFGELIAAQKSLFRSVTVRKLLDRPAKPEWPYTVNHAWRSACDIVGGRYGEKFDASAYHSWLFFEPDVTPLVKDWAPRLEAKYVAGRKPFMGYVHVTSASNGAQIEHMNGAGVYPVRRWQRIVIPKTATHVASSQVISYYQPPIFLAEEIPWDVAGLCGIALAQTQRLTEEDYVMAFGTKTYTPYFDGGFVFEGSDEIKGKYVKGLKIKDQILHHGCKDGSLMDCLSKRPPTHAGAKDILLKSAESVDFSAGLKMLNGSGNRPIVKKYPTEGAHWVNEGAAGKAAAIADFQAGMVFKQVMKKHRLSIKQCAAIKKEAEL